MASFKNGDFVSLKSDSFRMTVSAVDIQENGTIEITCCWRDRKTGEIKYETFPSHVLKHWEDPNA
ncbi:DUF2158 domain-containing protein [Methylobacillus pratensis]